jgi:hypothetical protein
MVRKTTFPTTFGDEVTLGFGYTNNCVGVHANSALTAYADKVRIESSDDGINSVWFKTGNENVGFVYMDNHVARRVGIEAEHSGVEVEGL